MNSRHNRDELEAITVWMEQLAATPPDDASALDPVEIWWKGELLRRWDAQRQAAAPIQIGERLQVAVGAAGAIMLLVWLLRRVPIQAASSSLSVVILASVLLVGSAAAFAVWSIVVED
jgi:hypothetical protein